jgi:cyanate lyase
LYEIFRGEVAKVVKIRRLSYQEIADMTGFKRSTICAFMCGARNSDQVARAIGKALGIDV